MAGDARPWAGARGCASSLEALVLAATTAHRGERASPLRRRLAPRPPRAPGGGVSPRRSRAGGDRVRRRASSGSIRRRRGDRSDLPSKRAVRVAFGPCRPSRRGRRSEQRLRRRRREPASLGPGVTRRHSRPCAPLRGPALPRATSRRPAASGLPERRRSAGTAAGRRSARARPRARRPETAPTTGPAGPATGRRAAGPAAPAGALPRWSPPWGRRRRHARPRSRPAAARTGWRWRSSR